jgi:nitrite reductase/ring-hydroxylating ferredoxin subunit
MTVSAFIRNGWYMACWSHEVPDGGFLARRLLDKPWVIWRKADGEMVMMADRCPHRFVPLSRGGRDGDKMRCGYHGLAFDGAGNCAHNPFSGQPLDIAKVEVLPVVEKHTGVWFWPGDAEKADPALIPDYGFLDHDKPLHRGTIRMKASYELVTDNLMDLIAVDDDLANLEAAVAIREHWLQQGNGGIAAIGNAGIVLNVIGRDVCLESLFHVALAIEQAREVLDDTAIVRPGGTVAKQGHGHEWRQQGNGPAHQATFTVFSSLLNAGKGR